jgi:hypothetical protein
MFIALDPITALHLGLSNDPKVMFRAELLANYILKKVPNHILNEDQKERRHSSDMEELEIQALIEGIPFDEIHQQQQQQQQQQPFVPPNYSSRVDEIPHVLLMESKQENDSSRPPLLPLSSSSSSIANGSKVMPFDDSKKKIIVQDFEAEQEQGGTQEHSSHRPLHNHQDIAHKFQHAAAKLTPSNHPSIKIQSIKYDQDLKSIFTSDIYEEFLMKYLHLEREDAQNIYTILEKHGFVCMKDLIEYLNEMKQYVSCTCHHSRQQHYQQQQQMNVFTSDATTMNINNIHNNNNHSLQQGNTMIMNSHHSDQCASRQSLNWISALQHTGLGMLHIMRLIQFLKPYLK